MAWRKLEDTFYDNPKIKRLAKHLAVNKAQAAGHIALLWSWALRHAPDGDLTKYDDEDIEDAVDWQGARGDFVASCFKVALLDGDSGNKTNIHNWLVRGGTYAQTQRKQRSRQRQKIDGDLMSRNVTGHCVTVTQCPSLEENRREENIDMSKSAAGAADQSVDQLTKPTKVERTRDDIQEIWRHYRGHHPSAAKALKSDRKEYQLIRSRLEDFGVDQLKAAIDGYHRSSFHCGDNKDGKRYQGLTLIMRDVTHVQAGIEMLTAKPSDNGRPRTLDPTTALGDTCD